MIASGEGRKPLLFIWSEKRMLGTAKYLGQSRWRTIPSLRIAYKRVVRGIPSRLAAPRKPPSTQFVSRKACTICSHWASANEFGFHSLQAVLSAGDLNSAIGG